MGVEAAATPAAASGDDSCRLCGGVRAIPLFVKAGFTLVRCSACGLVSLRPLPPAQARAAHHEASYAAGRYASFASAQAVRAAIARVRLAAVQPLAPSGPWLDVGCSTGAFVEVAAASGLDAEGLELSAAAVEQARARGLAVVQGEAESFVPARRFAVVTAFDVVEHLPDPAAFVRRVGGWLLPGGMLALTLPNVASPAARVLGRHWFYYAPPDHIHYFTPATVRRLLEDAGLVEVQVRPARKPLTLEYAAAQVAEFMPRLAPIAGALAALVPRRWRARPWALPLGEMLVTARPAAA
jgi:2-polyprenyl-3-methyl-5-hydroxy-6-metoxy-1,4-benzoquinol methylase